MGLSFNVKLLLVLVVTLIAVITAFVAGLLTHIDGHRWPTCIRSGSTTFCVALTLLVLILSSIGALS